MDAILHPIKDNGCDYLSIHNFQLIYVSKTAPAWYFVLPYSQPKTMQRCLWLSQNGTVTGVTDVMMHLILIEAECHIYASLKWVTIGSHNGLSPIRRQAIIWINAGLVSIGTTPRNTFQWNLSRNFRIFIQENVFENVGCKMEYILFRYQCV